jgi:tryptophan-rich sensory protein
MITPYLPALVAGGGAVFVAVAGGALTEIGPWYRGLAKPSFQPPDWLFGPAWTLIFALSAWSAVTAWEAAPDDRARRWVIILFVANGALNVLWSLLFFKLRRPDWALVEVALLWASILVLIVVLGSWSRSAALMLAPYLAWVSFAAVLNWAIVRLNAPFG